MSDRSSGRRDGDPADRTRPTRPGPPGRGVEPEQTAKPREREEGPPTPQPEPKGGVEPRAPRDQDPKDPGPKDPGPKDPGPKDPDPNDPGPKGEKPDPEAVVGAIVRGPRTPLARLLAVATDPAADRGKKYTALRAAEQRTAREAVRLRRRALLGIGADSERLNEAALDSLRQAAAIGELLGRVAPPPLKPAGIPPMPEEEAAAPPPDVSAMFLLAPPPVVTAQGLPGSANVVWAPSPSAPVDGYVVVPIVNGNPGTAIAVNGNELSTVVQGLTNGSRYRFTVAARKDALTSAPSAPSNEVVIGAATSFVPVLPELSSEPAALIDALADTKRRLVSEAGDLAKKWRSEHLKAQAVKAAHDSMLYEEQIAALMAMNLEKVGTAELLLNPVLQSAAQSLTEAAQQIVNLADADPVDRLVGDIASTSAQALLLQRLLVFLAEQSPVGFWVGLFDALIDDVASFDGGIPRTRRYLGRVFDSGDLGVKVQDLIADIRSTLDQEVERVVAPLRDAVAAVIGGTSEGMNEVFGAFDEPLVMQAASGVGLPDVPNGNPLQRVQDRLEQAVESLADLVKQRINEVLDKAGGKDLFVLVAATYLVLPILAFLVIAVAGGPFSAAALAAVVLLAAQELVRLILRWLAGPLQRRLDELVESMTGRIRELHAVFAREATLIELSSPQPMLEILASELRELKNLLPAAFLDDAAALLDEARAVVLRTATQLALGAEQALGMESGTAFDAISFTYDTGLTPAAQMPGGTDPTRLAGAAVLRDLGRLEQQRIGMHDGKEMEVTQAIPLDELLPELQRNGQAVVDLTESDLIDSRLPGFYRAMIKEVRLHGVLASGASARLVRGGVPIVVTHLGENRTRVKRGANPAAPPIELPDCPALRGTSRGFARSVLGNLQQDVTDAVLRAYRDAQAEHIGWILDWPFPVGDVFAKWFDVQDVVRRALAAVLPSLVDRAIRRRGCGYVDPAPVLEALDAMIARLDLSRVPTCRIVLVGFPPSYDIECPDENDVVSATLAALPWTLIFPIPIEPLRPKLPRVLGGTVFEAVEGAHRRAVSDFRDRIAKWGDAYLVEDPDPNVRALGFATLVRPMPEESAVFNLAAAAGGLVQTGLVPVTGSATSTDVDPLQYRPFENRGVEGRLLVRAPVDAVGALAGLTLEVVLRGCHDAALASTVRASGAQDRAAAEVVKDYAGSVAVLTSTRRIESADLRTVRLSLRAHRDRTLLTWTAAKQADLVNTMPLPAGLTPLPDLSEVAPLRRDQPFTPLPTASPESPETPETFVVRFSSDAVTSQDALSLRDTLVVTPADLGLPRATLDLLPQEGVPALVSVGLAVIPTQAGARTIDADDNLVDPLPLAVSSPEALQPLLASSLANASPRFAVSAPDAEPVPLTALFGAEAVDLSFAFGDALATSKVYDVILSLTYRVPVLASRTALGFADV